jgi:hypothetical protein
LILYLEVHHEGDFLNAIVYREIKRTKNDLYLIFINLKKVHGRISRNVMWWMLEKKKVSTKYITFIKDIYTNVVTNVRACDDEFNIFSIKIVMDEFTNEI